MENLSITQQTVTCIKLKIEILEKSCEICSKLAVNAPDRR